MPIISLESLIDALRFRLINPDWTEILDLGLVTLTFYLLLNLVRQSRTALLLRGALVLSGVLFLVTIILPLPAFDWLIRSILIAILIVTPIIFQPELRRLLERIGHNTGLSWGAHKTAVEQVLPNLVRAVENMAATKTGALIALEGGDSLQGVIETGVAVNAQITSELLQAIFYSGNPLHDGAVVIREERVIAAGCVLPLTQRPLQSRHRLGTRHRAATGLSETSDAMVVVVSEETGTISAAHRGQLHRPLDSATLRQHLFNFYTPTTPALPDKPVHQIIGQIGRWLWRRPPLPSFRQLVAHIGFLLISLLLAIGIWMFVIQQINPTAQYRQDNVPLQVRDIPPNTEIVTPLPGTVSVIAQTTASVQPTLSSRSFQAFISLAGLEPGSHRVSVEAISNVEEPLRIISVDPSVIDLELAQVVSRTMEVVVELTDQQNLSRAYQVVGGPTTVPTQTIVTGAAPLVEQVNQVRTSLSLANASTSLNESRPLRAVDEAGRPVNGVSLKPPQVEVHVTIRRRINARDVGVRIATHGDPADGYWLSGFDVTPANVTIQGNLEQLNDIGSFVNTLPIDINNAAGDISIQIPLDLPPDVQAVDSNGNAARTVSVQVHITPRQSVLTLDRRVEPVGLTPSLTVPVRITPPLVDLILNGPLPTLNEIASNADLVQVVVEINGLEIGQSKTLTPTVTLPENIRYQLSPSTVVVSLPAPTPTPSLLPTPEGSPTPASR